MHFSLAFDEGYHLEYITFIKQHNRIPITYQERAEITRADFPPLYHLLVSFVSFNVNIDELPDFKFFWDSFRYRAIDYQAEDVWIIQTEDYGRPYLGRFLVWQIGRWTSIVLSLGTVIVVYLTLREIPFGKNVGVALVATALLAFIPRYIILGSSLNDDNLLGLLAALYFWMLVKVINHPFRWWPFIGMGVFLGLSITVKYTLILIPFEVVLVCGLIAHERKISWYGACKRIGIVCSIALLCSSWWFGWNLWFLNTVAEDGWTTGLLRPLMTGGNDTTLNRLGGFVSGGEVGLTSLPENTNIGTFTNWIQSIFLSFWGVSSHDTIPFFPYIYIIIGLMILMSAWGLWRLWQTDDAHRKWLVLFIFHIGLFVVLPLIRFVLTRRLSVAAQGRHILIPAATAFMALLVWGLLAVIPQRWQRLTFVALIVVFMGWTGAHLYRLATFSVTPLPLRTVPQAAEWLPNAANTIFGDSLELVTYQVDPQSQNGVLNINLAWRSLAPVNENYLLDVTLLNSNGGVVSYWQGYNGQGRVPTLAWEPGDTVFDRLVLPAADLPVGDYALKVQLLNERNHQPIADPLSLPLTIDSPLAEYEANTYTVGDAIITLWQVSGPVKEIMPVYRYPSTIAVLSETTQPIKLINARGDEWLPTRSEAAIHTFIIGPRWSSDEYRIQVESPQGNLAVSEPLLAVENWWERDFEAPDITIPLEANFANQLKFLGYNLPQNQVKAGEAFPLTLYWQALPDRAPQAHFIQFNHLLDGAGKLRGGYDRQPLEYYSTLLWAPGEVVVDGFAVPVDADAPPGEYFLDVGYYLQMGEAAVNLPLVVDGERTDATSVTIGPIEVVQP